MENRGSASGCGFILVLCASMCLLLIVNSALAVLVYNAITPLFSEGSWLRHPRVAQAVLFASPVGLIIAEWWLYDVASNSLRGLRESYRAKSGANRPPSARGPA